MGPNLLSKIGIVLIGLASPVVVGCVSDAGSESEDATESALKRSPPDQLPAKANAELWSKYCGKHSDFVRPIVNYGDPLVVKAAKNLSLVSSHSFALYSEIKNHHKSALPAEALALSVKPLAHEFLSYLCGEHRDRATMVEAKLRWVGERFNYLDDSEGSHDPAGDPWRQMKKADYRPYLELSQALFAAKRADLAAQGKSTVTVGTVTADYPVPAQTVCETKYMFAEYVKKARTFDSYEAFKLGYQTFRDESCSLPDDEDYYYDFRGDSNIKPNSPESNGMIWFARTVAKQCNSAATAPAYREINSGAGVEATVCRRYFKYPFSSRFNAARAGMASWVVVDPTGAGLDSNSSFTVVPRSVEDPNYVFGDRAPYLGRNEVGPVPLLSGWKSHFNKGGFGLDLLLAKDHAKIEKALQLAVDRHTDWYDSGYDDQMPINKVANTQAYSPFVASSYEMSESDNFTSPGITVKAVDPTAANYKHWMFVFRVHKKNWFTPLNVAAGEYPNFDRHWFDETSFGDTGLANSEKAWDRMGTALEGELDTLLYLHNLPRY